MKSWELRFLRCMFVGRGSMKPCKVLGQGHSRHSMNSFPVTEDMAGAAIQGWIGQPTCM